MLKRNPAYFIIVFVFAIGLIWQELLAENIHDFPVDVVLPENLQVQRMKELKGLVDKYYPTKQQRPTFFFMYAWEEAQPQEDYCYKIVDYMKELGFPATSAAHGNYTGENIHTFFERLGSVHKLKSSPLHHLVLACSRTMMRKYHDRTATHALRIVDEINSFIELRRLIDRDILSRTIILNLDGGDYLDNIPGKLGGGLFTAEFLTSSNIATAQRAPIGSRVFFDALEKLVTHRHIADKSIAHMKEFDEESTTRSYESPARALEQPPQKEEGAATAGPLDDDLALTPENDTEATYSSYAKRLQRLFKKYQENE